MTTLISWVGVDQRAPASLYIAADSRITWGSEHWDRGAKTFASPTTPDVLGYCGDVLFPALVLPQFVACLGADLIDSTWKHRRRALSQLVERSIAQMPRTQRRKFTIVYCSREGKGMQSRFRAGALEYHPQRGSAWRGLRMPKRSRLIYEGGSGAPHVDRHRKLWDESEAQGGTSRAEYGAFVDALREGKDSSSGGPPQLVGLYRTGNGRYFGTRYRREQFVAGAEIDPQVDGGIEWRGELFERVGGPSRHLLREAKRHEHLFSTNVT